MSAEPCVSNEIGFWRTVQLLLKIARRRSSGRMQRQQQLLQHRTGSSANTLGLLAQLAIWGLMAALNAGAAYILYDTVRFVQRIEASDRGIVLTHGDFVAALDGRLPAMMGTLVIIWWLITLIFQGEGLELDLQRRRHPMWEWVFSHPVRPGAVFFAEMLSPIAANPIYVTAPLFFAFLYGFTYGEETGIAAAILIGVPVAIATACAGKAFEIGVILRFAPRTRGALIGFMGWLGYAAMMSFLFLTATRDTVVPAIARALRPVAMLVSWPLVSWAIGLRPDGSLSFLGGMFAWWLFSAIVITGGVWFTVWGAQRGLAGAPSAESKPAAKRVFALPLLRNDPLYRKEILWFLRDRGAIVQTILVPVTIAAVELFNLRGFAPGMHNSWQGLAGAAVIFGTYFLWVLGPRSLASEGMALWLAQTWPRGLEELMKAKARLWFLIASGLVMLVLIFTLVRFPTDWWKVVLIGIGWCLFGRSMAAKSVTLVTAPSSSGGLHDGCIERVVTRLVSEWLCVRLVEVRAFHRSVSRCAGAISGCSKPVDRSVHRRGLHGAFCGRISVSRVIIPLSRSRVGWLESGVRQRRVFRNLPSAYLVVAGGDGWHRDSVIVQEDRTTGAGRGSAHGL